VSKPVVLIVLGALSGMIGAVFATGMVDASAVMRSLAAVDLPSPEPKPTPRVATGAAAAAARGAFSFCLNKAGADVESTFRDLIAFHDHETTLTLTECLLTFEPQRFCGPDGAEKAENAMEIYLWSRDVARVRTNAHAIADKIRLLGRTGQPDDARGNPDPFTLTWSGPRDRALFDQLKTLAREGYLDPGAFGYSVRPELRVALTDVKPIGAPCVGLARAE
jgi:hypothetical protein